MKAVFKSSPLSVCGIFIGTIILLALISSLLFNPDLSSGSGSGGIYLTSSQSTEQPGPTSIAKRFDFQDLLATAILLPFLSLALGVGGFICRESKLLASLSLAYGFTPIYLYTLNIIFAAFILFAVTFSMLAVHFYRRIKKPRFKL